MNLSFNFFSFFYISIVIEILFFCPQEFLNKHEEKLFARSTHTMKQKWWGKNVIATLFTNVLCTERGLN